MGKLFLLPCPFCGAKPQFREIEWEVSCKETKTVYDIQCKTEGCYMEEGADWNFDTKEEVAEMWNKRFNY